MSYACDELYRGYVRRNMAILASKVKVSEIAAFLPCLTETDREEINARRDISGNFIAMQLLLECLRRRENWPEQFISALESCEQITLAKEIRHEYNTLSGRANGGQPAPSPPAPSPPAPSPPAPSPPALSPPGPAVDTQPVWRGDRAAAVAVETPAVADPPGQPSPPSEATPISDSLPPRHMGVHAVAPSEPDHPLVPTQAVASGGHEIIGGPPMIREALYPIPAVSPSGLRVSPEKLPVQEMYNTNVAEENLDPTFNSVRANGQPAEVNQRRRMQLREPASSADVDHIDNDNEDRYFSKPGILTTAQVHRPFEIMETIPSVTEPPYSGGSSRLEISASSTEECHQDPEDHYDSQDVRTNLVWVSEEPPVLNNEGQAPLPRNDTPLAPPEVERKALSPYALPQNYSILAATTAAAGVLAMVLLWRVVPEIIFTRFSAGWVWFLRWQGL